ncbi:MAG: GEVED domain-containing protein, partial [Bacteroidales bacterium]|nr:GEVED domain-containing protein [Bacteroidales bacterium]
NNNGFLDPGETASMVVTIQNAGSSNASAVMAQLTSTDLYVSVLTSAPQAIGTLAPGITGTATFTVHAAANTPFGHTAELTLNMTAAMGISQQDVLLIEFSDYCEASTTYQDEFISKVVCGDINNSSGWQNAVANYTDITTTLEPGVPVPITITNGNAWSSDKVTVWIDWNLDKDLGNNPNETFVLTSNGGGATFTGNIVAPAGQQSGQYRMRIRMTYSSDPQPCGNSNYGEVEDYTILIGAPMYLEPPQNVSCSVTGSNVSLSWEAPLPMASSVSGYRIYMDDEMVAAVETGLTYVHNNCPAGSHWFSVSAVYPEGESEIAQPVHVEVGNIQGKLQGFIRDAATNLVINDAWVTTVNGDYGAVSYSTPFGSHYTLHLMGGTYNVICNAQGYTSATHNGITLENGGTTTVNFYLMPTDSYGEGTTTGIGKYDTEDLSIYPNPASTVLNISITGAASSARYTLLNYQGSTVYTHEIGELSGFAVQQLDISEYAAGIYYLRLETDQNVTIRKVVIK